MRRYPFNKDASQRSSCPRNNRWILLLLLLLPVSSLLYAQNKIIDSIRGVVKNDAGESLAGATIFAEGTKLVTTSKKDGSFVLRNVPEGAVLHISYIGHATMQVRIKPGQTDITVRLAVSN